MERLFIAGVKRLCQDIEFMLHIKTGWYWRLCWSLITPGLMFMVLIYTLVNYEPLRYKDTDYPYWASSAAWCIWAVGVGQLPFWAIYTVTQQPGNTLKEVHNSR